jgi:hypothetical protein
MDPNTTLALLYEAMADDDHDSIIEHCDALIGWLDRGGFVPSEWDDERIPVAAIRRKAFRDYIGLIREHSAHIDDEA